MPSSTVHRIARELRPTPLVYKFIILVIALSSLSFIPKSIAAAMQGVLLILFSGAALTLAIAAYRDLGLSILPSRGVRRGVPAFKRVSYNGLEVFYTKELNGGGLGLSHEYVRLVSTRIGKVAHAYEFCAGPGFIGFNLLANNLCDRLTLSDVNPEAIEALKETVRYNGLEDRVTIYQSDNLDLIPTTEKWDLVVGNPPWDLRDASPENLILCDPGGKTHDSFFRDVHLFLNPGGTILFGESHEYTKLSDITGIMGKRNLTLIEYVPPASPFSILGRHHEYGNISKSMKISLRLATLCLGIYFLHFKPAALNAG